MGGDPDQLVTATVIDAEPLSVEDVAAVASGAEVRLGPVARERIAAARAIVDRLVSGPELIYGLNTGLGHMRNERVPIELLRAYQPAIVSMHDGAIGEALPARDRARSDGRASGRHRSRWIGSKPWPWPTRLSAMLNAGVHPVVPRTGSVGASDLMHMAAIGLVLLGQGRAEYQGQVMTGGEALQRAGIEVPTLEPKDGLALISANGMSVGHAALLTVRAERAARLADLVLAVSLEAVRGNLSIIDPAVARAKPLPGQIESSGLPSSGAGGQREVPARRGGFGPGPAVVPRGPAGPWRAARSRSASFASRWRSSWRPWTTTRWSTWRADE